MVVPNNPVGDAAGTTTVIMVAVTDTGVTVVAAKPLVPPKVTVAPVRKSEPVMVIVAPPAVRSEFGTMVAIDGGVACAKTVEP